MIGTLNSICKTSLLFALIGLVSFPLYGQGIKGFVSGEDGKPLAFATVFARNLNDGIPTNQNGYFEWNL
ncbi:carboxypeptidase-like regulatory domain-containing protein, partial [uncultured Cyclobacterium sp.]|uniref:carboxypeptidase-like regulatory domain-containing protein n=1 Tax=uncultured Cyclobacterium sp. TaxID=453820 RepID=UPI0030EDDABA